MPHEVTRRRFMFQSLGVLGGAMVAGDLLPLLAEAATRKQVLRVAIERDFETLRPELSAGDTINILRRLIYTTPILWGMQQRPDGSLIYDMTVWRWCSPPPIRSLRIGSSSSLPYVPTPNLPTVIPSTPRRSRSRMPGSWAPRALASSGSMACPVPTVLRWSM